ncbi:unnamed protein product [Blepharisma stoltei]|uniref:Uncharacterized protein n=1 Tax=Blepharisma stoltei TaxID=1481888 RepID=A0AAU9JJY8_9CILI|nr:unnamed protein product [Blepharisma stoltei]
MSNKNTSRARSAQPQKKYNPEVFALSNLIQQASDRLAMNKSKSYATKLKERQTSRKSTSRDYDHTERNLADELETPKNRVAPQPQPMHPINRENDHPGNIPLQCKHNQESDRSIGIIDKISTINPSDLSFEKKSTSVDRDNLLSIVRDTEPKAEFRTPGSNYPSIGSKGSSPERGGPRDVQYLVNLEKRLTEQRIKYKKLEKKYKELLAKHSRSEEFYENTIQKLTAELNELKEKEGEDNKELTTQKVEENSIFKILQEIDDIKKRILKIEQNKSQNQESLL